MLHVCFTLVVLYTIIILPLIDLPPQWHRGRVFASHVEIGVQSLGATDLSRKKQVVTAPLPNAQQ